MESLGVLDSVKRHSSKPDTVRTRAKIWLAHSLAHDDRQRERQRRWRRVEGLAHDSRAATVQWRSRGRYSRGHDRPGGPSALSRRSGPRRRRRAGGQDDGGSGARDQEVLSSTARQFARATPPAGSVPRSPRGRGLARRKQARRSQRGERRSRYFRPLVHHHPSMNPFRPWPYRVCGHFSRTGKTGGQD